MTTIKLIKAKENELVLHEIKMIKLEQKIYKQQCVLSDMIQQLSKYIRLKDKATVACAPTIEQVLHRFIIKNGQDKEETQRKYNVLSKYIKLVGLKNKDKYSEFHTESVLLQTVNIITDRKDIQGNQKIRHMRWIISLIKFAVFAYPDLYKTDVLVALPIIPKTPKCARRPHTPYTDMQLKSIFNPQRQFFRNNPDFFWGCMIALFTGARKNAAFTLQYKDIFQQDNLWCINFIEDYPGIKKLKTEDSQRIVPIHSDLIKLGFLDYIKRKPHISNKEFIFPICLTSGGRLNTHLTRKFFNFLTQIGIKDADSTNKYDFHSFRKNANITMERCGMIRSYIDKIIGWMNRGSEGERSYSNYTLPQISEQLELLHYECLKNEFKQWKKIMSGV